MRWGEIGRTAAPIVRGLVGLLVLASASAAAKPEKLDQLFIVTITDQVQVETETSADLSLTVNPTGPVNFAPGFSSNDPWL